MPVFERLSELTGHHPVERYGCTETLITVSTRADGELTSREREVTELIAEGLTNSQLAERLFISPKTAAVHVSNILTKLGLSSRVEIAAWAFRHGVVRQAG